MIQIVSSTRKDGARRCHACLGLSLAHGETNHFDLRLGSLGCYLLFHVYSFLLLLHANDAVQTDLEHDRVGKPGAFEGNISLAEDVHSHEAPHSRRLEQLLRRHPRLVKGAAPAQVALLRQQRANKTGVYGRGGGGGQKRQLLSHSLVKKWAK